jgi:hypothetical protein
MRPSGIWPILTFVCIVVVITLIAYQPTLFNFFNSDDFFLLNWLKAASKNPAMVASEFGRPWMGIEEIRYYRPLVNIFLLLEYQLWGANGLYFRLGNIFYELVSSVVLGLIVFELGERTSDKSASARRTNALWACLVGVLFALYPLHCEPVNWVVSRIEMLSTLFLLLGLWCYIRWQSAMQRTWQIFSLIAFVFALGCKEMAVVLPPLLVCYELFVARTGVRTSIARSLPWWILLAVYVCIRRLALGTFVGGWDPAIAFYTDQNAMLREWLHGLRQMVFPLNASVLDPGSAISVAWYVVTVLALALSVKAFWHAPVRGLAWFLLAWWILSLAPLYRFFMIDPNLLNARLAYLATAPLCMFATYGLAKFAYGYRLSQGVKFIGGSYVVLAALVLAANNQGFARAGLLSNRIVSEIARYYASVYGDPPVKILGLPLALDGAYLATNAIDGMTKTPFQKRDIYNCRLLEDGDQSFPLGLLKVPIASHKSSVRFLFWDGKSQELKPADVILNAADLPHSFAGKELYSLMHVEPGSATKLDLEPNGSIHVVAGKGAALAIKLPKLPCWPIDFLEVTAQANGEQVKNLASRVDLLYANDIVNDTFKDRSPRQRCHAVVNQSHGKISWLFPLHAVASWVFGGKCAGVKLLMPRGLDVRIETVSIVGAQTVLPQLDVADCQQDTGIVRLNSNYGRAIRYDASTLKGCSQVSLEVLSPGANFPSLNSNQPASAPLFIKQMPQPSGTFNLEKAAFQFSGLYKARIRAFDIAGNQVGVSSDHILIWVEP